MFANVNSNETKLFKFIFIQFKEHWDPTGQRDHSERNQHCQFKRGKAEQKWIPIWFDQKLRTSYLIQISKRHQDPRRIEQLFDQQQMRWVYFDVESELGHVSDGRSGRRLRRHTLLCRIQIYLRREGDESWRGRLHTRHQSVERDCRHQQGHRLVHGQFRKAQSRVSGERRHSAAQSPQEPERTFAGNH